jgi:MSHA biogenesis protein MshQ
MARLFELLEKIIRKNGMKFIHVFLFIQILCAVPRVQAVLPPQLEPPLDKLIIYSGAAVTLGASTKVAGSIRARDAGTIGADSTIEGNLTAGDAATLGANTIDGNIMVDGDLTAGAAILIGSQAVITGNLRSGANASANLGVGVVVGGNATAGTALTFGVNTSAGGNVQAGTGAIDLGVNAAVGGDARAGTSITLAAGATVGGTITPGSIVQFTNDPKQPFDNQWQQLSLVQQELALMLHPPENILPAAMTVSTTLTKGVYFAPALTTTAGITLTFDGEGVEGHWLINVESYLAFGASTKIECIKLHRSRFKRRVGRYFSCEFLYSYGSRDQVKRHWW